MVHGQMYLLNGLHLHLARLAGVRHRIAHMHPSSDVRSSAPLRILYRRLMAHWIATDATCLMFPSQSSARACAALGDFSRLPQFLIPNCVDLDSFRQTVHRDAALRNLGLPSDRPLIVFVGRFVAHKNHALLIEVADALTARGRRVHIVLAGSHGDCLNNLQERIRTRSDISILVGLADVAPLLQCATAFVLPSLEEGFGVVAIEAQAAGVPVVASDLPAIREALAPTAHDLLFPPNDASEAAERLDRLLGDDQLRQRTAADGRRFSERFSISASAKSLVDAYRMLVDRQTFAGPLVSDSSSNRA
jgi:glycosyltransferase involved in cell wall biosynthesis